MTANAAAQTSSAPLPPRYYEDWKQPFFDKALDGLKPGAKVLDVGSGRMPSLKRQLRPDGCDYVGLDISEPELKLAPEGSYDSYFVGDIADRLPELAGQFDLVVTWQVLEHVKSLDDSLRNIRDYLKPGGRFVGQFSGTFSAFGLINQVVPSWVGPWAMKRLLGRAPDTVFPAYYHHCWHSKITAAMAGWASVEITPRYRGAVYWRFFRPLQVAYLVYENWAVNHGNLATHYLIDARA